MYKSCSKCGKMHDINYICNKCKTYKKDITKASKFRNTYKWKQMNKQIRVRDKHLCRVCIANLYYTTYVYNYNKLEVHHIISIEQDYDKRLDDDNLITLCSYHHRLAEDGVIPIWVLQMLIKENINIKDIKRYIEKQSPLPIENKK